jgi:hypothetical protein
LTLANHFRSPPQGLFTPSTYLPPPLFLRFQARFKRALEYLRSSFEVAFGLDGPGGLLCARRHREAEHKRCADYSCDGVHSFNSEPVREALS